MSHAATTDTSKTEIGSNPPAFPPAIRAAETEDDRRQEIERNKTRGRVQRVVSLIDDPEISREMGAYRTGFQLLRRFG